MFNHTYLVIFAHQNKNANGTTYQTIEAKNKKQAVEKALKNLTNSICVVVSVKRVPKKIMELIQKHNEKVWDTPKEGEWK